MKRWLVVGVESSVPWPTVATRVRYGGQELLLRPGTETERPDVAFLHSLPSSQAHELVRRFLSALCWAEGYSIREAGSSEGGSPIRIGRRGPCDVVASHFGVNYLPDPGDAKAKLALALYREAQSLDSIPYRFLSLFKVVNALRDKGEDQKALVAAVLPILRDERAQARLRELGHPTEAARYLYESGRCAIAHAFSVAVDPDRHDEDLRLQKDIPLMEALVRHLIEHELGVKSRDEIRRQRHQRA